MRIAYFDCFSGIAGDMVLGSLIDAGLDIKVLSKELKKLKLSGYEIKKESAKRGSLTGTKFSVVVKGRADKHSHRSLSQILKIIDRSSLKQRVKDISKKIFNNIGGAEAKIHGIRDKKGLYLHELGDIDSIIDIVGSAIAFDALGIDGVYSSPVHFGSTFVNTRHGVLPAPAPAALELLKGAPLNISDVDAELVTPTGAGILKTFALSFGRMPQIKVSHIGYGAGERELKGLPNMLRVIIGETSAVFGKDRIFVIETNIDDMNPQHFEYLFEKLFDEGALDVYTASIQMKKTRPAFKLTAICGADKLDKLCSIIFKETTSIGIRYYEAERFKLERKTINVKTRYGRIKVKVSSFSDGISTVSPEYEECARAARAKKVPLKAVFDAAKMAVKV